MDLSLNQPHLSIRAFPDVSIPPLTVVMGLNGSGKSHMLQAIANGSITNSVLSVPLQPHPQPAMMDNSGPVRLLASGQNGGFAANPYTPASVVPPPTTAGTGPNFTQARQSALAGPLGKLNDLLGGIEKVVGQGEDIWRLGAPEVARRAAGGVEEASVAGIFAEAEHILRTASYSTPMVRGDGFQYLPSLPEVAKRLGISELAITEMQARQFSRWGMSDQFQPNIAMVFGSYRDAVIRNRLMRMQGEDTGRPAGMSDAEFVEEFGPGPWTLLNETLHSFGLPYDAVAPELYEFAPYTYSLIKRVTGEPVAFQNLSSGEKVLLQFALSTYQYDEGLITVTRPQVLLLDEMDASLHPEMVHRWLGAISNGLVAEQGMNVILTTHSPTTVALAPEDSLYEMRDGFTGLTKISKQDALNRLTFGVPTLSIDYSGQRQVFAESDTDAGI